MREGRPGTRIRVGQRSGCSGGMGGVTCGCSSLEPAARRRRRRRRHAPPHSLIEAASRKPTPLFSAAFHGARMRGWLPGRWGERCAGRRSQLVFRNRRWSAYAAIICGQSCKRDSLPADFFLSIRFLSEHLDLENPRRRSAYPGVLKRRLSNPHTTPAKSFKIENRAVLPSKKSYISVLCDITPVPSTISHFH